MVPAVWPPARMKRRPRGGGRGSHQPGDGGETCMSNPADTEKPGRCGRGPVVPRVSFFPRMRAVSTGSPFKATVFYSVKRAGRRRRSWRRWGGTGVLLFILIFGGHRFQGEPRGRDPGLCLGLAEPKAVTFAGMGGCPWFHGNFRPPSSLWFATSVSIGPGIS